MGDGARRSPWRFGVPVVCLLAGMLLAATHGVSGGAEIRRGDAPRLVDLVREAQATVDRLAARRDDLAGRIDSMHGRHPGGTQNPDSRRWWRPLRLPHDGVIHSRYAQWG